MSLAAIVARRLLWTIPLLLGIIFVTFAFLRAAGGSPFRPPEGYIAVPYSLERELVAYYRLDDPFPVQYLTYVKNVATLNFGPSLTNRYVSVDDVIRNSFPVTAELVLLAAACAVPLGILLGLVAALRRTTAVDVAATSFATLLLVVPIFFVSFVLSRYVVFDWRLVPAGWDGWRSKVLPTLTLALAPAGYIARLIRAQVVETLQEDYVRTARAKGLRAGRVIVVHVLRNSLGPFFAAAVPMLALLITGALFVERDFRVPGASIVFLEAARTRDYPMLLGVTVALATVVLAVNLVADVLLAAIDPRLREGAPVR